MALVTETFGILVLLFPLWMILYWIPKCDVAGIKKANERIAVAK